MKILKSLLFTVISGVLSILPGKPEKKFHDLSDKGLDRNLKVDWTGGKIQGGIFGGLSAKRNEFPWLVLFYISDYDENMRSICGGVVVSNNWIVSAAHCFHGLINFEVEVRYNAHEAGYDTDSKSETLRKHQIIIHEDYDKHEIINDIALIKANKITHYRVPSAQLAVTRVSERGGNIPRFYVAGWGVTEKGRAALALKKAKVQYVALERCLRKAKNDNWVEGNSNFCAYDPDQEQDSCQGDSGGPLFTIDKNNGQAYVHGLVSFGAEACATGIPSVYTNIPHFTHWIQTKTQRSVTLKRTRILNNWPNQGTPARSSGFKPGSMMFLVLGFLIFN